MLDTVRNGAIIMTVETARGFYFSPATQKPYILGELRLLLLTREKSRDRLDNGVMAGASRVKGGSNE